MAAGRGKWFGGGCCSAVGAALVFAPAMARDMVPAVEQMDTTSVVRVAPDIIIDHVLMALMFEPDWRLAVALFQAFHQGAATTSGDLAVGGMSTRLAREILLFLPLDQGRQAAPALLRALAPDDDAARFEVAVDLAGLVGEDPDALIARAQEVADHSWSPPLIPRAQYPLPLAAPMEPLASGADSETDSQPPEVVQVPVDIVVPEEPAVESDDESESIVDQLDPDRQWTLLLYHMLSLMPDYEDRAAYARWYVLWLRLTAGRDGVPMVPLPVHGGDSASPR